MIKILKFLIHPFFLLSLILILAFFVRTYKIDNPIADWHSWRQADTAAVSRNFYKEGYNPFVPKYDDMSGVAENPVVNLQRYRFVEFPIYNSLVYFAYLLNGGVDEKIARLVSIIFSLGSIIFLFLITRKAFGNLTALIASFIFAVLPFNIFFSRVILPEPSLVFFSLGAFYFTHLWILEKKLTHTFLSLFFVICAILTKPVALFYLVPLIFVFWQKEKRIWPIPKRYWVFGLVAFLPFIFWRVWISQHPEGIPASNWLFNGNGIRFKPVFWQWIFQIRLGQQILTIFGSVLFFVGLLIKPRDKEGILMHLLAISAFLFLIVFATGNVQHDYYQYLIVPVLCIFVARGLVLLLTGSQFLIPKLFTIPLAILFMMMMIYTGWEHAKGLYQINNYIIVEAGKKADEILPKNAVVLAPYMGDTSFLYQINRPGWAMGVLPTEEMIEKYSITHYVSVTNDDKTNWLKKQYTPIFDNDKFFIIDMTKKNPNYDSLSKEP